MAERPNIHQQIEEVERELAMRRQVYPGLTGRGKLRQRDADEHMRRMEAVLGTLLWCRDHRDAIAAVAAAEAATVANQGAEGAQQR